MQLLAHEIPNDHDDADKPAGVILSTILGLNNFAR
jgi:hypothetical protein